MRAALIGDNIGPSLTPALHEAEGKALGINYSYLRFDTALIAPSDDKLRQAFDFALSEGLAGLNVTHPHKMSVLPYLDRVEGAAAELGAVNTVLLRNGEKVGYNTDYSGFYQAIAQKFGRLDGAHVMQLGAGGAGGAVALALADRGARRITMVDPAQGRAKVLAERLSHLRPNCAFSAALAVDSTALASLNGVVNCTPLGMAKHPGMAADPTLLDCATWVADIVYFPRETALLQAAHAHGCDCMDGTSMALWQAVGAFELITGHKPDPDRMRRSLAGLLARNDVTNNKVA